MTFYQWWTAALAQRKGPPFITEDMRFHFEALWDVAQSAERNNPQCFPRMTYTHTYAILEIHKDAFGDIAHRLELAGYQDQFHDDGTVIDMHGLAIQAEK